MRPLLSRKRLVVMLAVTGFALMGLDLLITRNPFVHVGELMVLSLLCLAAALFLDRRRHGRAAGGAGREATAKRNPDD